MILSCSSAILGAFLWHSLRRRVISYKANHIRKHGVRGEKIAEQWLKKNGFQILSIQDSKNGEFECNGETMQYRVKPDIIAENEDGLWVIEVKTGKSANPSHGDTRRQILEYAHLYPDHKTALFDADHKLFQPIVFFTGYTAEQKPSPFILWHYVLGFILGLSTAALVFYTFMIKS
jgi:Holliday junction resolvase-like predicted endonuclease